MELTRRDALAALAVSGAAAGVGAVGLGELDDGGGTTPDDPDPNAAGPLGPHERETLVAVAEAVFPSEVSGVETFVTTYLDGRQEDRAYVSGATEAVATLDDLGRKWFGDRPVDLDPDSRDALLRDVGADTAEPDPEGSPAERVRYYLVNEVLYALYASPTGGKLVGIENPQGHPGGQASYQRGPRP